MKNNKKKLLVILLVVLLVIVALVGSVVAMVFTGKLALTDKQKLAKGLNDIKTRFSVYSGENNTIQEYEKMYTTPFESQTTITGSINKLDIEGTEGMEQILSEIKEIVGKTKFTNTVQADFKNKIVNENLKVEMGDVVEGLSLDFEYNNDTIALRLKELNEKYLTLTKNDVGSNSQYEDLADVFEMFDTLCEKVDIKQIAFTDEEKNYFKQNYTGIFSEYLTDEMITSTETNVNIDGNAKSCSAVTVTFNKTQIRSILGEYLNRFENDTTAKSIILNKLNSFEVEITESDMQELIQDMRSDLETLPEDAKIVFTVYGNNLKTYGFDIVFADSMDASIIKAIFDTNTITVKLISSETEVGMSTATETELGTINISENELNVLINAEDTSMKLNLTEQGNIITVSAGMSADGVNLNLVLTNEQLTNTDAETSEKNSINLSLKVEEMALVDVTLNVNSNVKYLSSIPTTTLTSDNSVNIITGATTDLQQYITDVTSKAQVLLQTAQQNSTILNALMSSMQLNENQIETETNTLPNQTVQVFNSSFTNYQGLQKGAAVKALLQAISINNNTSSHGITLIVVEGETIKVNTDNSEEIILAMNNIMSIDEYIVAIAEYDTEGYIKTIAIKKN